MFETRLREIKKKLKEEKTDAVFISSVSNITYLTGYDNFSEREREAYLIITKDQQYLVTDGRYTEDIKKIVPHFTLFERSHQNKIEDFLKSLKDKVNILAIEEDNLTVSEHRLIKKHFKTKHFEVNKLRSIKNSKELEKIEKACQIGDLAFEYILKKFRVGVSEEEIASELENFIKSQKGKISFPPIVAIGANSAVPHHQTGQTKLGPSTRFARSGREGLIVLLDFGVKWENYCSDMTRTVFLSKPSKKHQQIYKVVLEAQERAIDFVNSNKQVKAAKVDKVARDYIISQGYPNLPHSLGHGIGLEVHEHPYLSEKSTEILKEGMVFSIEPGIYLPDFGGVRIEDLLVYERRGLRQITTSSKKLIEV